LPSSTTAQLIIDPPAFMTFRAQDMQATSGDDFFLLLGADLIVVGQHLIESLAEFIRRLV
jgi:hypothetical protein